jgi:hypothetical protein
MGRAADAGEHTAVNPEEKRARVGHLMVAGLFLLAGVQRGWNAYSVPPLIGYDAPGHAGYVLTVVRDGRLPHPLEGWSTFHPPLYYLLGSVVWTALEPLGPRAVLAGLRGLGALAGLAAGLVAFVLVRRLGGRVGVAWVTAALVLFVPCAQMAGAMVGNEAFAAGMAALALPPLLALQANPSDLRAALLTGLALGLAMASKFTGLYLAGACVIPFLRADVDRRMLRALALLVLAAAIVGGPVYARNLAETGTLIPMTRNKNPMRDAEASLILRPRRVLDYVRFPTACLERPYIMGWSLMPGSRAAFALVNEPMNSVWGLTYATMWNDAFGHRLAHMDVTRAGKVLAALGLVPTAAMVFGFLAALVDCVRTRARSREAPLVSMAILGLAAFVTFSWRAPSIAAVKASYLLPLTVPGAVFFAGGVARLPRPLRRSVLLLSGAAAVAAALVFTNGLLFTSPPMEPAGVHAWSRFAAQLPTSRIADALAYFIGLQ